MQSLLVQDEGFQVFRMPIFVQQGQIFQLPTFPNGQQKSNLTGMQQFVSQAHEFLDLLLVTEALVHCYLV